MTKREQFADFIESRAGKALLILIVILILAAAFIYGHITEPERTVEHLRAELASRGGEVSDIIFTPVEPQSGNWPRWGKRIYTSSEPILYNGQYVDTWEYSFWPLGSNLSITYVEPYPPMPAPVAVTLKIPASEYEQLQNRAGDQSIEEYILQLIESE